MRTWGQVCIAAKLGCAVEHAGLAAHEEGADAVLLDRRKDFAYRVRDQASLPASGNRPRVSRSRPTARRASGGTNPPIPRRQVVPQTPRANLATPFAGLQGIRGDLGCAGEFAEQAHFSSVQSGTAVVKRSAITQSNALPPLRSGARPAEQCSAFRLQVGVPWAGVIPGRRVERARRLGRNTARPSHLA